MGKSTPSAPDYTGAAEATAESNAESINMQNYANRMNQYNPWGSLEYGTEAYTDPATGQEVTKWSQNQEFSPLVQSALDSQFQIADKKNQFASQMMDKAGNTLLQDTDYRNFGNYGAAPSAFGLDGSRRVNNRPTFQSPAPINQQSAGWYTPTMPSMDGTPPPINPAVGGQVPPPVAGQVPPPVAGNGGLTLPPPNGAGNGGGSSGGVEFDDGSHDMMIY